MSRAALQPPVGGPRRRPWRVEALVLVAVVVAAGVVSHRAGAAMRQYLLIDLVTDEQGAMRELRKLAALQEQILVASRCGNGRTGYGASLSELGEHGLIDPEFASGRKHGYEYELTADGWTWSCTATPRYAEADRPNLIICTDAVVRSSRGAPATCDSAPVP